MRRHSVFSHAVRAPGARDSRLNFLIKNQYQSAAPTALPEGEPSRRARCPQRAALPNRENFLLMVSLRGAKRRGNPFPIPRAAEDVGPYKRPPKILPFPVGRGPCLPTVVPADSRPLTRPTAGALPRNRLASSAAGGASAISPACISYQNLLKSLKSFL